jgi:hypothetical protein
VSQHYNPGSARSTLAASLLNSDEFSLGDAADVGKWIEHNSGRVHIYLSADQPSYLLTLLEAFVCCRLTPRFEGR